MPFTFTITTSTGFPITPIPGVALPEEVITPIFPSVYGATEIEFDVQFEYREGTEESGYTYYPIKEVYSIKDLTGNNINIQSVSTDTVTVSGSISNLFSGEYYRFLMSDLKTELNLPPINNEDWIAILKWSFPTSVKGQLDYEFEAKIEMNTTTTITSTASITQEVFWNFNFSYNQFLDLVNEDRF